MMSRSYLWKIFARTIQAYINHGDLTKKITYEAIRKAILPKVIESVILTLSFLFIAYLSSSNLKGIEISADFLQVFSGILGFAITAFAIVISSFERIIIFLEASKDENKFGAQIIYSDMMFPIVMITLLMLFNVLLLVLSQSYLKSIMSIFSFIYGILLTLELISILFVSARFIIMDTLKKDNNDKSE